MLKKNQLSELESEKILIQVDTFDQGVIYETERFIINRFDITRPIIVTPKSVILAQKLWTITQRKVPKGRDFYDILFLLQNSKPDKHFLLQKFGKNNLNDTKTEILEKIEQLDFAHLVEDVRPFLVHSREADRILYFKDLLKQSSLE